MTRCIQLLDYLASNSDTKVRYYVSNMLTDIHSDDFYLSELGAQSRAWCGHFFMGWMPQNRQSIKLNGMFHMSSMMMWFVVASMAEAKLGALFHNCQTGKKFQLVLADLCHPQPKMPMYCNDETAMGITNTVKCQRLQSIEMQCFCIGDKVAQEMYKPNWHPGLKNVGLHHIAVWPYHLHQDNPPWT